MKQVKQWFTRGTIVGAGIVAGMIGAIAIAVTVGTIKTWTTGETLTAADLNSTITSLKTALEAIPNWTKSGTNAVYTDGNVGIGTTAPSTKLDVSGPARVYDQTTTTGVTTLTVRAGAGQATSPLQVWQDSNGSNLASLTSSGRFGIGTTSPYNRLSVAQDADGEIISYHNTGTDPGDEAHQQAAFGISVVNAGNATTGLNCNASAWGGCYQLMVTSQWGNGAQTASALYFVKCGFDGNNMTAYSVSGDTTYFTLSQQNGYIYIDSIYSKLVTWWRLS